MAASTHNQAAGPGGFTKCFRLDAALATTNPNLVQAYPGRVFKIRLYNARAALVHFKLYNKATAPVVGTDIPVLAIACKAADIMDLDMQPIGIYFDKGIGFGMTLLSGDSGSTAVTAGDLQGINIWYA